MTDSTQRSAPTCYRHTQRETYIQCSRCERYICPDCMSAAPVGFQCPECVAEGKKSTRQAKTVVGGGKHEQGDLLTKILIGVNVVLWLFGRVFTSAGERDTLTQYAEATGTSELAARFALVLGQRHDGISLGVVDGEWYRLITAAFLHEQIWHIGMNMLALWLLGSALEPVLGRWRFLALYFLAALGGTAASLLTMGNPYSMSLGASGAVFGLLGALFIVMRKVGGNVGAIVAILGINVVLGFSMPNIDWRAHLGGLVVGAAVSAVFAYAPRKHRSAIGIVACIVIFAIILLLVAIGTGIIVETSPRHLIGDVWE